MISYEVCMGLILMTLVICCSSFNLTTIVEEQELTPFFLPFFPTFIIFFISCLAETSRIPFDFPEAESELVSGYNVEYSSVTFVFFFLSEYCHIILMSTVISLIFLGG
jgi:NADH-quinone oxidoreductase subunit H